LESSAEEKTQMCLDKICRTVRNQVLDLGTYLWEEDNPAVAKEREALESQCTKLAADISSRRNLAGRYQAELVELRRRLLSHEKNASSMQKRIEILHRVGDPANAWSHALRLEELRLVIHHQRSRLKTQQRIYQEYQTRTDRLEERLADLQDLITFGRA
jgi:two-component SAPR family response regulator